MIIHLKVMATVKKSAMYKVNLLNRILLENLSLRRMYKLGCFSYVLPKTFVTCVYKRAPNPTAGESFPVQC